MAQVCYKYQDIDMGPHPPPGGFGECNACCQVGNCNNCSYTEISMAYPYTDAHCASRANAICAANVSGNGLQHDGGLNWGDEEDSENTGSSDIKAIDKVLMRRMQELANIKKK